LGPQHKGALGSENEDRMAKPPLEIERKLRQYKRILLSYADFKHAKLASSYILSNELHEQYPEKSYVLLEALNCSMIMAYCRPFSGNDSRSKNRVPDLPARLLRVLSSAEKAIHEVVMEDRNKVLAHSDSEALQIEPVIWQVAGKSMVLPLKNWGLAPLNKEATVAFHSAAEKLFLALQEERSRIEPELIPYFRVVDPNDPFARN
jgi:hypothetical protein